MSGAGHASPPTAAHAPGAATSIAPASAATRRRSAFATPDARVWCLTVALVITAFVLWRPLRGLPAPNDALNLSWLLLAGAFATAELCVVHLHFRRSAHSLTLGEIPLVLGLLFAPPADVVVGWVLGACLILAFSSRQAPVRLIFNLSLFAVTAGVAAHVFRAAVGGEMSAAEPRIWAAVTLATLLSAMVAALLLGAAMRLSGETFRARHLARMVAVAAAVAATNACMGLAAGVVVEQSPWAALLLLGPIAALLLAYRAYTSERAKHSSLEFLLDASRTLSRAHDSAQGLAGLLAMAVDSFRAASAEVCFFATAADGVPTRMAVGTAGEVEMISPIAPEVADQLNGLITEDPAARAIVAEQVGGPLGAHLARQGVEHAMLAPLPGRDRVIGTMLIANRVGVGGAFSSEELELFETLAGHAGSTLGQDRLGQRLTELNAIQSELEHQAFHDPLTGLANRLLVTDRVRHSLSRRNGTVAVLYIDLDDFKTINDTMGHDAGDDLLVETAVRLRRATRTEDTPGRLGGDEFVVLLLDVNEEQTRVVADRILSFLAEPFELAGRDVPVFASLGAAVADSGSMEAEELLRNADVAMYVSKHGGKRGYSVYDAGMDATPSPADLAGVAA
ncbi:MAG: sensor domain-containing diguanylate cyclase [Solirubrobacterales bacterium]|nr:sensor domain-containing diguanylate cyclase [Solirubrobacterales bacterium]